MVSPDDTVRLLLGDAADLLPSFAARTFDAIVTDPPFGLLRRERWDASRPPVALWRGVLRVLKPGGRLVVFADDRVSPWLTVDIVAAGFEFEGLDLWLFAGAKPRARNQPRPAWAPIIVARAPGAAVVGKLDDDARIPWRDEHDRQQARRANTLHLAKRRIYADDLDRAGTYEPHERGRWPSNVLASDDLLERQQHLFQVRESETRTGTRRRSPSGSALSSSGSMPRQVGWCSTHSLAAGLLALQQSRRVGGPC